MLDRVRLYAKSIVFVAIGLNTMLSVASSAAMKPLDQTANKSALTAQQNLSGQSQTLLPDGRLLLAGGQESGAAVSTVYFQNTKTGALTAANGTLLNARAYHSATVLPTGTVLIFGGINNGGSAIAQQEIFDPARQTSTNYALTGLTPRSHHTATLLTDGRVLIAGGLDGQGNTLSQIEVWDYRAGQSVILPVSLKTPRSGHIATLLPDGSVLLWGGQNGNGVTLNDGEIIDPNGPSVRLVSRLVESALNSVSLNLAASIPQSGETGIPIEQLISLRFSKPLDVTTLNGNTIALNTSQGDAVTISVIPAEGGRLAFIEPQNSLQNSTTYVLSITGATDVSGKVVPDTSLSFTTVAADNSATTAGNSGSSATGATNSAGDLAADSSARGLMSKWKNLPPLQALPGVTALAGQVLTLNGSPLPNVLVQIDSQQATTDNTGRFLIQDCGSGHHILIVNGGTASTNSNTYGIYRVGVDLLANRTNSLNYTVWMTALDTTHVVNIPSPTTRDMVITNPGVPGLELHLPAGTVIHDVSGNVVTQIGITPIPMNQPPFPLKKGIQFPVYFTIQPGGATFSNAGKAWSPAETSKAKGATIHYQNQYKGKPGARFNFWNYDPTQKGWYVYGHGRVSADAKMIEPEQGTQIYSFDGAMVSQPSNAPPGGPTPPPWWCPWCSSGGDPVNLQTGLFVYTKTDLAISDIIPLILSRTYRQGDYVSRSFGIGANMPYNIFMVGDDLNSPEGYTWQDLITADGGRVHFTRTSPCTGTNGNCAYGNAIYTATSTPGEFYGATLVWTGGYWTLTKKDGTVFQFPDSSNSNNPQEAAPKGMHDRYGNALVFTRDGNGNLLKVTSPNGRWIQFTYDSSNRITGATDNLGRSTSYTYYASGNGTGYLATATDVKGGVTTYTYDSDGNMLTIKDPNGVVYLQNHYNANNMVDLQTQADGSTFQFGYTLDSNGNVTQTNITDPRGYVRTVTYNSNGYPTANSYAVGKPEQQTTTYNVQPGTGLLLSSTDSLNRTTSYSYDSMADVTSVTLLAGTTSAVTSTFSYNPEFYQLASITDPLGNSALLTYDSNGNMIASTDPLGNTTKFAYNAAGQPVTVTDSLSHQTQLSYDVGSLVAATDALGRTVSRFVDNAGRVASITDPLGHTTRISYDAADEVLATTDPLGHQTTSTYDGDGNLLTVTDANQHTTKFAYNNLDQIITRTDPLGNAAKMQYDLNGNLSQFTDRKGQVTTYTYDGLNRTTNIKFADGSTIANTFDAGSRLTGVTDSITGTIAHTYDGFNHLLTETTPQGTVKYTYDADGRRKTMTASGQSVINYYYNKASQLTSIVQGSSTVGFAYDSDRRRTSLTLPNGVVATYSYDAASQLTGISYQGGALSAANLVYTYDQAGRRVGVSGSLASTQLPAAVASAAYNANNQLTKWGATALTYDLNGNTLNDGTNAYTWDARNRLVSANNNGATFAYDPLGRRVSKKILTASTSFLYDGVNPVQELSGTTVTANLLIGGVDERFTRTTATETDNYLTDALGSTVELTSATGATEEQYSYSPFGSQNATGGTTTNSYTYTGRETDGLGINYYRARYYNPTTGRFLSEDPLGFGGGINEYTYALGSPLNLVDPSGLASQISIGVGGTIIAPFVGGGLGASVGLNLDGWNSSAYIQGQANGGFGGGAFAGYGVTGSYIHGAAPTTGFGSADYAEADLGFGPGFTGSLAHDENGTAYGGGAGLFGGRVGEGAGLGVFVGKQGTGTLATPSLGSLFGPGGPFGPDSPFNPFNPNSPFNPNNPFNPFNPNSPFGPGCSMAAKKC